jgi:hypothetical protein
MSRKFIRPYYDLVYEVAAYFDGITPLARALNITQQSIYQWETKGIPKGRAYQIEVMTHHEISSDYILRKQSALTRKLI